MEGLEEVPDRARAHVVALLAECLGEPAGALTGPPPRRPRVAASRRLHQRIQGLEPCLIRRGEGLAARPLATKTPGSVGTLRRARQLLCPQPHCAGGEARRTRHRSASTMPETERLRSGPQTACAFVQLRREGLIRGVDRLFRRA